MSKILKTVMEDIHWLFSKRDYVRECAYRKDPLAQLEVNFLKMFGITLKLITVYIPAATGAEHLLPTIEKVLV